MGTNQSMGNNAYICFAETHVESLNRSYDRRMPFFFTGAASYLNQNIQKVTLF